MKRLTFRVKRLVLFVKQLALRVKHLTLRVKHLTLRVKNMTLRVKQWFMTPMAYHIRSHPVRKRLSVRALRRIDGERLDSDLASFAVDNECVDVNTVVARYNELLSSY